MAFSVLGRSTTGPPLGRRMICLLAEMVRILHIEVIPEKGGQLSLAERSVRFAIHPVTDGAGAMVERYTFSSLRDFLYVELGKAIEKGCAPLEPV